MVWNSWERWLQYLTVDAGRRFQEQLEKAPECCNYLDGETLFLREARNVLREMLIRDCPDRIQDKFLLPIDIPRIIDKVLQNRRRDDDNSDDSDRGGDADAVERSDMTPFECHLLLRDFFKSLLNWNILPPEALLNWMSIRSVNTDDSSLSLERPVDLTQTWLLSLIVTLQENLGTHVSLIQHHLCHDSLVQILSEIQEILLKSLVVPGSPVGPLASESVGEKSTQMLMNTFHFQGEDTPLTGGISLLIKLINAAKKLKTPAMRIVLDSRYVSAMTGDATAAASLLTPPLLTIQGPFSSEKAYADAVAVNIINVTIADVIVKSAILQFPMLSQEDQDLYNTFSWQHDELHLEAFFIKLELKLNRCFALQISPRQLTERIIKRSSSEYAARYSQTTTTEDRWIIHLHPLRRRQPTIKPQLKNKNNNNNKKRKHDDTAVVASNRKASEIYSNLQLELQNIIGISISGINRVVGASAAAETVYYTHPETGRLERKTRWVINTQGSNFTALMRYPEFDFYESNCNNGNDIDAVLGISACQYWNKKEIKQVMKQTGSDVDPRHVSEIVKCMTYRGTITPMTRYGISKEDVSTLECAAFEKPLENLFDAAFRGKRDTLDSVTDATFTNQKAPLGTGLVHLLTTAAEEAGCGGDGALELARANDLMVRSQRWRQRTPLIQSEFSEFVSSDVCVRLSEVSSLLLKGTDLNTYEIMVIEDTTGILKNSMIPETAQMIAPPLLLQSVCKNRAVQQPIRLLRSGQLLFCPDNFCGGNNGNKKIK